MESADFDWTRVRAFVASADARSFSAAARQLRLSQPTVGRQVAALEEELGAILFERIGRTLKLTAAGTRLLEHARLMARAADGLSLAAAGQAEDLTGRVSITASDLVASELLAPVVADLRLAHPGIELDLVTTNDVSDLARREADIAVRHFRPKQPELVGRKVADGRAQMYASTGFIDRCGPFRTLNDLHRAEFIGYERSDTMVEALTARGVDADAARFPVVAASSLVQRALARRGVGIAFLMTTVGDADPALRVVLPDAFEIPVPIWLVCHRELRTALRFRVVFDTLAVHLERVFAPIR